MQLQRLLWILSDSFSKQDKWYNSASLASSLQLGFSGSHLWSSRTFFYSFQYLVYLQKIGNKFVDDLCHLRELEQFVDDEGLLDSMSRIKRVICNFVISSYKIFMILIRIYKLLKSFKIQICICVYFGHNYFVPQFSFFVNKTESGHLGASLT